jgi:dihydroorotate dehydrogenase
MTLGALGFTLGKPLLHAMDAETAHKLTLKSLALGLAGKQSVPSLPVKLFGLEFPSCLGLAPGFDKNAEVPDAMLALGFGFVEIGTVTPKPQSGNPRPRLFRLVKDQGVINRMGFNNDGHDVVLARLEVRRNAGGIVGVNIGANKDSDDRIQDYVLGLQKFSSVASYITVNISSPNTPGLRNLQGREELKRLLDRLNSARKSKTPMLLKIAPDLSDEDLSDVAALTGGGAVDGVVISNTTLSRPNLCSPLAQEAGGLSGRPLFDLSTEKLRLFHHMTSGRIPLIGAGGISDAATARAKLEAGASLLQLYSGLVYRGPTLVREILTEMAPRYLSEGK